MHKSFLINYQAPSNSITIDSVGADSFITGQYIFGTGTANVWTIYVTMPNEISNSITFRHMIKTSYYSYWWFNGTQTTTQSEISDERIKQNITPIENPISKLMLLKPKQYNLCDDKDYLLKYGLIAQEVEKVLPDFVVNDEEYSKYIL